MRPDAITEVIGRIWRSRDLVADFERLTALGGRFAGSESEARAREFLLARMREVGAGAVVKELSFQYDGWSRVGAHLDLLDEAGPRRLPAHSLVWSPPTPPGGLEAEVLDLGRGTKADFDQQGLPIKGAIVLVRHEYPFVSGVIHRRVKYGWAKERGAAGFLIAANLPGQVMQTGSSGRCTSEDIPAAGVTLETAEALSGNLVTGRRRVRLHIDVRRGPATASHLCLELPGRTPEWVVLSAHYDGHDLAQSALDNATGAAAAVEITRQLAPLVAGCRRGLRLLLFTVEEWGLYGSQIFAESLSPAQRAEISVNINLDTIAGSSRLAALVSDFPELVGWVDGVARGAGLEVRTLLPFMPNSDHASFARLGIPALRLVAGFDDPTAGARYSLTSGDTRDKVSIAELKAATVTAAELVWSALNWEGPIAAHRSPPHPA